MSGDLLTAETLARAMCARASAPCRQCRSNSIRVLASPEFAAHNEAIRRETLLAAARVLEPILYRTEDGVNEARVTVPPGMIAPPYLDIGVPLEGMLRFYWARLYNIEAAS